jgi:alpha-mannosidase
MASLSIAVTETIGKPEQKVMVAADQAAMQMSGSSGAAAFVDLRTKPSRLHLVPLEAGIPGDGCYAAPMNRQFTDLHVARWVLTLLVALGVSAAQSQPSPPRVDLTKEPTLYLVGYAHLDTEWRWEYPQVIQEFLPKTLLDNFALIEEYPDYVFNFTGAYRYKLFKEYYPDDYERLKKYIAAGRWFPAGSSVDENDVNSPSAESIFRQILYGNGYFRHEFGKASAEYMLPDCFGFPASLPSILAHAGIKGFSTQKLSSAWQPAPLVGGPGSPEKTPEGIPFNVGIWVGTDGTSVMAALNPGGYGSPIISDLSKSPGGRAALFEQDWPRRIQIDGDLTGIYADYHYYGTGDTGGSPAPEAVKVMEAIVSHTKTALPTLDNRGELHPPPAGEPPVAMGDGPVHVISSKSDQMFLDIIAAKPDFSRFPHYQGDLELINHSAGSLTSEAYRKRWNRKKELLADAAEKASVAAQWLGARPYPQERLNNAWMLTLEGQMHDILPGTATPKAYQFVWNDDVIALNQFADILTSAVEGVASGLDTQAQGTPVVVYNPLNIAREDVVEADISSPNGAKPTQVRVLAPDGREVLSQVSSGKVLFLASAEAAGFAVYDLQTAASGTATSELKVTENTLENGRYRLRLDTNGDVASIFDKAVNKELLAAPVRLAIKTDNPQNWPAWNMDYDQEIAPPRAYVTGPPKVRIVEKGPVRVALEVTRETERSRFVQTIRLAAGEAGSRVEFANVIDWMSTGCNLKACFPLSASNTNATYNWDIGTVQRPTETERQFEVASHQWVDLTDQSGSYGATVLTDCKNGSDKPDGHTLRLTLIRTPGTRGGFPDQATQDIGRHEILFGLAGHAGDWRQGQTDWQGQRLNQPLIAFASATHPGSLGKTFSLLNLSSSRVRVLALKKAEESDELVIRLVELDGKTNSGVQVAFAAPVIAAREINAQEQPLGEAIMTGGKLQVDFTPCQPRTFAVKLSPPATLLPAVKSVPVSLPYNRSVASLHGKESFLGFDDAGNALPGELLPKELSYNGIRFELGPAEQGKPNAVATAGQKIQLPAGSFNRVYLLAAAARQAGVNLGPYPDEPATFLAGGQSNNLEIQGWTGFIGQWDNRLWTTGDQVVNPDGRGGRLQTTMTVSGLVPGYIKRAPVAWYASHHHLADGSAAPYSYSYLYAYSLDIPSGATSLTLPDNPNIRILAVSVAEVTGKAAAAGPLYDTLDRAEQ